MSQAEKVTLSSLQTMKREGRPISMITAYDYPTAQIVDQAGVDTVLVGDSLGNVMLGYQDTIPVSMDEMIHHTKAVRRGVTRAFLIGDMPFMSYNISPQEAIRNSGRFSKEALVDAVKIEGGDWVIDTAARIIAAGIPVVGHLGLTPQTASSLGGYRVQGRTAQSARKIMDDALGLEQAGVCLLVLECVPDRLGSLIAQQLSVPVIGIGAGNGTDGQVLVYHDLVGIHTSFKPKFVKRYAQVGEMMKQAVETYCHEVKKRSFPDASYSFRISDEEFEALKKAL